MDNPSAFPVNSANLGGAGAYPPDPGMDLRDYFAGQALAGLCANHGFVNGASWEAAPNVVITSRAYSLADAMLAERNRVPA